ncbi:MAG: hypothetical protein JW742_06115 [Candidatus Aminicenantes bacterium]|nr:hypothetical protein [Candidatus Aminicenantes bacterium]
MSKWLFWIVLVVVVLGLAALVLAGQSAADLENQLKAKPDDPALLLRLGRVFHDQAGLDGRTDVVAKAERHLSRLLAVEPDNAPALVYRGSLETMKAKESGPSLESLEFLNRGFAWMDRAVLLAPDDPEVRLVRAVNGAFIPVEFGRGDLALEDFRAIERITAGAPGGLPPDFTVAYSFYYGRFLAERGERAAAKPLLKKVLELAPGSPLAAQAAAILDEREST